MFDETKVLIVAIVCLGGVGIAFDDEPSPCATYNEMRQIHVETSGEYGWPKGAIKECEDETIL